MPSVQDVYDKLGIVPPDLPFTEKIRQVMAWYPNKAFYKVRSAKSGKEIVSIYPEDTGMQLMSHDEWFAQDFSVPFLEFDAEAPFFEEFGKLLRKTPVVALLSSQHENSEYCHDVEGIKNCYLCIDSTNCENNYYCVRIFDSSSCVDCYSVNRSKLLYECVHVDDSYNTKWSLLCRHVTDSYFLFNCRNVSNSFMCSNLRNREYCIFNEQKTKEEFEAFMADIDTTDYVTILEYRRRFRTMMSETPIPPAFVENCEDSTGSRIANAQHCANIFEAHDISHSYNAFQAWSGSYIADGFLMGLDGELIYFSVATGVGLYYAICCVTVWHSSFMEYCYLCIDCKECFGCVGLKNRSFCIFNKQYTEEEYREKKAQLIAKMRERDEYGRFFPQELSPFHYEDTIAYDYFDNADADTFAEEAALSARVLDADGIQTCPLSGAQFRYIPQEKAFYAAQKVPYPRLAFAQRHAQQLQLMDTGFLPQRVCSSISSTELITYYGHPNRWNIVTEEEYQKLVY